VRAILRFSLLRRRRRRLFFSLFLCEADRRLKKQDQLHNVRSHLEKEF
jgi:hypothetical protein